MEFTQSSPSTVLRPGRKYTQLTVHKFSVKQKGKNHESPKERKRERKQGRRTVTMSDMQREALAVLAEAWALSPDVRLGQLMAHLGFLGEVHVGKGLGYIEDDELIAVLYRHRAELTARFGGTANQVNQSTGVATSVSGSSTVPEAPRATER